MSRLALLVIVLLLASNGYTWYQKSSVASGFAAREAELLDAQAQLEAQVSGLEQRGDSLIAVIDALERRLAATRLTAGNLPRKQGLSQRLRASYPELAQADWGVIEVYDEREREYVEYMVVPLWMSETFILDHRNASQCLATR